jgi:hypothetical protein
MTDSSYDWKKEEAIGQVSHRLTQTIFPAPLEKFNEELLGTSPWEAEIVRQGETARRSSWRAGGLCGGTSPEPPSLS